VSGAAGDGVAGDGASADSDAPREIERVWLLRGMPAIPDGAEVWRIEQGYLDPNDLGPNDLNPGSDDEAELARLGFPEGRLRRIVEPSGRERFLHTVKSGSGVVRIEREREITAAEFAAGWPRTAGRRLSKTRHRVREGGLVWEIDRFDAFPFAMAEVELPAEDAPCAMPAWLAPLVEREVSEDPSYRNYALARRAGAEGGAPGGALSAGPSPAEDR
jgi:CYTH domain-containing protein